MNLDINTERGQAAAADQLRAMEIVYGRSGELCFLHTPTNEAAPIDGFVARGDYVIAIAEVKSRDMTHEHLMRQFNGEWLLTMHKLADIAKLCGLLRLPGYGFLFCKPSRLVLAVILTDKDGRILCDYRTAQTETQATCNGGKANRVNAFIKMHSARIYREQ